MNDKVKFLRLVRNDVGQLTGAIEEQELSHYYIESCQLGYSIVNRCTKSIQGFWKSYSKAFISCLDLNRNAIRKGK